MEELGPEEQRWLDVLRAADEPGATDRARVRASVLAVIAGASAGAATATAATTAAAAGGGALAKSTAGGALLGWKIGAVVVAVLTVGGGGTALLLGDSIRASHPTMLTASAPASVAFGTSSLAETPATVEADAGATYAAQSGQSPSNAGAQESAPEPPSKGAAESPPRGRGHGRAASSRTHADDVDAELVLLTEAQQALKRGDPNGALVALTRHHREHPRGALAVERDGLRAVASCEAKRAEGRALAERFVARNPSSPLVARVRAACLSP